ncbi:zinc finger, CCHC-type containing protein [Tanacetum coccineum]|uniref:Zinc finger, CCHC-type containing protein n=1 Tax=Tanacetum coccineum TaxID=301880 RepID=A0ABQ5B8Y6_9ASTR
MVDAAMKHMALNFSKLDKFEGVDFRRWQKKMHFLLFSMSVVYVPTTLIPEDDENATMEQIKKRNKPVIEQYNELLGILGRFTQHKMNIDEAIKQSSVDSDKLKGNNVVGPLVVNMVEHNNSSRNLKKDYKDGKFGNKANGLGTNGSVDDDVAWWFNSGATMHVCKDRCWLKTYESLNDGSLLHTEHSKAFRFYVIEPNKPVSINSIVESRDAIFDENRFSSVLRPSLRIPNGTEDINGSVVPEEVIEEVVQQPEPKLRKGKRNRTPKNFRHEFQLYLTEGTRDEVSDQHSYCFNVEDDPKTFDEAMNKFDESGKEVIICLYVDNVLIFGTGKVHVELTKEFLSSMFSMKDMGEANVILGIKIKHESNGIAISQSHYIEKAVSQLEYSRVIGCLMYAMTCIRLDIALEWRLQSSWASKKQTCISGSTMKSEFVALAAAGKEVE